MGAQIGAFDVKRGTYSGIARGAAAVPKLAVLAAQTFGWEHLGQRLGDSPDYPAAIAEARRGGRGLSVSEAVMRFDLSAATFVVFHSAAGSGVNAACQCSSG